MQDIITKGIFFIFVLPTLIFKEGYPRFEKYMLRKGWGEPKLFFAIFLLSIFGMVLWGMGYR